MRRVGAWTMLGWMAALSVGPAMIPSAAHESPEERVIRGEIVDPSTYLRDDQHGPEWAELTAKMAHGGQTLALLEEGTGTLYIFLAAQPGENPNEELYDYVNQTVEVTAAIYQRGGLLGIVASAIAPAQPQEHTDAPSRFEN